MMFLLFAAVAAAPAAFPCTVFRVHDGDGPLWCRQGPKIRVAGIQAPDFESATPCRASRRTVERLVLNKMLRCQPVDRSYSRVVARCTLPDGRSLSCATIAAGAAVRWDRYWRRYKMGKCS